MWGTCDYTRIEVWIHSEVGTSLTRQIAMEMMTGSL
jgi:hypothetical protein